MTETQRALALPNSAVLNMAPGANLSAYVQDAPSYGLRKLRPVPTIRLLISRPFNPLKNP